jgi:hypothetical protein
MLGVMISANSFADTTIPNSSFARDVKSNLLFNGGSNDPFIVDNKTTYLNEKCSFTDSSSAPFVLFKMPSTRDLNNYISIQPENGLEVARISFSDSSKIYNNLSFGIASDDIIYYHQEDKYVQNNHSGLFQYNGLCQGKVNNHIQRVNQETLECFNSDSSYFLKSKSKQRSIINKHGDFKVNINHSDTENDYFILEQDVYLPGQPMKTNQAGTYYQLCKKPIIFHVE